MTTKRNRPLSHRDKRDHRLRRLSIRSVRRNPPDYDKYARALLELAALEAARAEAEAQAQSEAQKADAPPGDDDPAEPLRGNDP